jgi:[methyl-Co(III) methanol-specific corrinoid protein]:coenzyme M methyltransferase
MASLVDIVLLHIHPNRNWIAMGPKERLASCLMERCINEGVDIAAPGCGISPKTPLANLHTLTSAVKRYGKMQG